MSVNVYLIIVYIQTFLSASIAAICLYPREKSRLLKLIGALFALSFVCNMTAIVFSKLGYYKYMNLPGSIYDIVFVLVTFAIYNDVFKRRFNKILFLIGGIFTGGAIINLLFFQQLSIASYSKFASSFIIISLLIFYFKKLIVELPTAYLHRLSMFWISSALLIYSSGALFLYAFTDYLVRVLKDDMILYWSFHNLLFIVQDVFIIVAIMYEWKASEQQVKS
jgi:hypothetical protein